MKKIKYPLMAVAVLMVALFSAVESKAVTFRTFVSGNGDDAQAINNCPRATPCRNFFAAYGVTSSGGEIVALDTAGYGSVTITTPVTITAVPGQNGLINVGASSTGITVMAGASDVVILRNLLINGQGNPGSTGLQVISGKVIIENSSFTRLTTGINNLNSKTDVVDCNLIANHVALRSDGEGVDFQNTAAGGPTQLRISGGNINHNTTAFVMANPGARPCMGCDNKVNIMLQTISGGIVTNVTGNTTFLTGTGTGCAGFCQQVQKYETQVNSNFN